MSEKRNNKYKITLEEIALKDSSVGEKSIEFDFENHDDIFALLKMVQERSRFESESDNIEFLVGLKLFSEVMLRNKQNPLFEDFAPSFREFMKKLKA